VIWPPGAGKTMLAKRLPTLLPPLTLKRSPEMTAQLFGLRQSAARNHSRMLHAKRTIADLAEEEHVSATHLSETIQYRRPDHTL